MKLNINRLFKAPKYKFNLIAFPLLIFIVTIAAAMYMYGMKFPIIVSIFLLFAFYFGIIIYVNFNYGQGSSLIDHKLSYLYKICLPTAVLLIVLFMIMDQVLYIQILCSIITSSLGIAGGYIIAKEQIKYYDKSHNIEIHVQQNEPISSDRTEQL